MTVELTLLSSQLQNFNKDKAISQTTLASNQMHFYISKTIYDMETLKKKWNAWKQNNNSNIAIIEKGNATLLQCEKAFEEITLIFLEKLNLISANKLLRSLCSYSGSEHMLTTIRILIEKGAEINEHPSALRLAALKGTSLRTVLFLKCSRGVIRSPINFIQSPKAQAILNQAEAVVPGIFCILKKGYEIQNSPLYTIPLDIIRYIGLIHFHLHLF